MANRPPIPEPVRRAVRQRCGFGCVICGSPLVEYDHIDGWAKKWIHDVQRITLLCPAHHSEKTKGLLPKKEVEKATANPRNVSEGTSSPYGLWFAATEGERCEFMFGTNRFISAPLTEGVHFTPIVVHDKPMIRFTYMDGRLLLSCRMANKERRLLLEIENNEVKISRTNWDVELEGQRLTLRTAPGEIALGIRFEPPRTVHIERIHMVHEGHKIDLESGNLHIDGLEGLTFRECTFVDLTVGIAVHTERP